MTTIYIDPIGTTTSLSIASTVGETIDSIDNDDLTTTLLSSTISSVVSNAYANCDMTNKYIDSLTDEQLIAMEQSLDEKDDVFYSIRVGDTKVGVELPKVYVKKGDK